MGEERLNKEWKQIWPAGPKHVGLLRTAVTFGFIGLTIGEFKKYYFF